MAIPKPPYPAQFRQQMLELVQVGRRQPEALPAIRQRACSHAVHKKFAVQRM
jgi:hypothetical protein